MKTHIKTTLSILLFFTICSISFSCHSIIFGDRDFHIENNLLYRGKEAYTLRAFYEPHIAQKGCSLNVMAPTLARIAEVGGNALALDLLQDSNQQVPNPTIIQTIKTYADRAKEQYMTLILRIAPTEKPRKNSELLKELKKNFSGLHNIVYWFDGDYAEEWIKSSKKIDRYWVIVGTTSNADILLCNNKIPSDKKQIKIYRNYIDETNFSNCHFIIDYSDQNLALIENTFSRLTHCSSINLQECQHLLTEEERKEGFIPLFDGKTLNGWWYLGDNKQSFRVNPEGYIEWQSKGGKALMSCERYDDFILRLEWKIEKNGNSGVWVRAPRGGRASKIGFEIQMLGDSDKNELTDDTTGAIYKVVPPKVKAVKPEGEWNELEIICQGPYVKVTLNGKVVQDINFDDVEELKYRLRKGFIGLTDHGNYCGFRNIRIKPLK